MDKIQRATEIHRSMTPHQMALRIVELEDGVAEIVGQAVSEHAKRTNDLLKERNATGIAIDNAIRGILPEQHPMLSRLQMLSNMSKRISELQDALELADEAVRAKQVAAVPDGWQLVPVDPTQKMLDAWPEQPDLSCDFMHNRNCAYQAMLDAAPKLGGE